MERTKQKIGKRQHNSPLLPSSQPPHCQGVGLQQVDGQWGGGEQAQPLVGTVAGHQPHLWAGKVHGGGHLDSLRVEEEAVGGEVLAGQDDSEALHTQLHFWPELGGVGN